MNLECYHIPSALESWDDCELSLTYNDILVEIWVTNTCLYVKAGYDL